MISYGCVDEIQELIDAGDVIVTDVTLGTKSTFSIKFMFSTGADSFNGFVSYPCVLNTETGYVEHLGDIGGYKDELLGSTVKGISFIKEVRLSRGSSRQIARVTLSDDVEGVTRDILSVPTMY